MRSSVVTPVITLSDDYKEDHGSRKRKEKKRKKGKRKKDEGKKKGKLKTKIGGKKMNYIFHCFQNYIDQIE
jgi:hypothetical protein